MASVIEKTARVFGPHSSGILMTPREFDRAEFEEGWRYELINGRLIVSPIPLENERDPNEELGRALRNYGDSPAGRGFFNGTLPEHTIKVFDDRRRADRVIWAGLGRQPRKGATPAII